MNLQVLSAVTQKRSFASNVTGLGLQSDAVLQTSCDGDSFENLELPLNTITSELNTLTANHKAYPILHYFHTPQATNAPVVGIVVLDELLTVLRFGVPAEHRPSEPILRNGRASVENHLQTLQGTFITPADESPPAPELDRLRDAGIPVVSDEEFTAALTDLETRRRTLLGLASSDARAWPEAADGNGSPSQQPRKTARSSTE
jgi:hypothetical protein